MTAQHPLRWLLDALPGVVDPEALARLMERYDANKRAYERQIKIRATERVIASIRQRGTPHDAAKLARWEAKLAKLKEEQG